jgi:hypothetical protein
MAGKRSSRWLFREKAKSGQLSHIPEKPGGYIQVVNDLGPLRLDKDFPRLPEL